MHIDLVDIDRLLLSRVDKLAVRGVRTVCLRVWLGIFLIFVIVRVSLGLSFVGVLLDLYLDGTLLLLLLFLRVWSCTL